MSDQPSRDLLLYLGDSNLALGVQYGLWVESSPSVEEQISLSSMSQDKLGHARAYYQLAQELYDDDPVALQYERDPDDFRWSPALATPVGTWDELVLAQALFARGLLLDMEAVAEGSKAFGLVSKVQQEEAWHTRHSDAWVRSIGSRPGAQEALDHLWPLAVSLHGTLASERFPEDVGSGMRTHTDTEVHAAFLGEVVPLLQDAGLDVDARPSGDGWEAEPAPSPKLLEEVRARVEDHQLELVSLLQDPEGRELAQL